MKLNSLDLNLLLVFDAILRTGTVTRAADDVGITQSSMSNALSRLREYFNDPLFVRTQGRMEPTPLAQSLAGPVQDSLRQLRDALEDKRHFDEKVSERNFRICMSEIAQRIFLPPLLTHLATCAPGVTLTTVDMSPEHAQEALPTGEVDLAIGYFADLGPNFFGQRLFQEHYVVLARKKHPLIGETLTLDAYLDAVHISYLPAAASHSTLDQLLDKEFALRGVRRQVGLCVAHSLGLSTIVAQTDLMLTVPSRLAQAFSDTFDLQVMPLPVEIPPIDIKQHWHSRYHHDPANRWLRAQFLKLFQK
ncbi:LysR family transcriptional regulator [Noviherbaspirillum denitrificans]|uniref:HTH lysR-type domain-containing protein n=1 Tax=Noviherbaspirillum denitrificans TaxID=1968433 RepID=A0A254TEX4_9BURK|nr:LysR family transcriptional regulator [Noviherbaspirillum denitrificans]OWW21206.1 hypothetical protein AYR66_18725 [Noviherbaspirillum denitrificans]